MERTSKKKIIIICGIVLALLLAGCLTFLWLNNRPGKAGLSNPRITEDGRLPGGKKTTWDCVSFGSYPNREVSADDKLLGAKWENDEAVVDGVGYVRMETSSGYRYFTKEPITWRVLEVTDDKALLVSHNLVDCYPYNIEARDVLWCDSDLRKFLNGDAFYGRAFSEEEKECILKSTVQNSDNYYFGTDCGDATEDYVFVLSEEEVFYSENAKKHGFAASDSVNDLGRRFVPTDYARARGAWVSRAGETDGFGFWFLRTNGYSQSNAVFVSEMGCLYNRGCYVNCIDSGVLPAVWVDLKKADLAAEYEFSTDMVIDIEALGKGGSGGNAEYSYTPVSNGTLSEPVIEADASTSSGQRTTWDCVYYGSYPQSEVIRSTDAYPVDEYAVKEGDLIIDDDLYDRLSGAEWNNNEAEVDGERYLRTRGGTFSASSQHYKWDDEERYHYFKYEPLKWRVIEINGDELTLLSDRLVDCAPYNRESTAVSWENSYLALFLDVEFYDEAFTPEEKEAIIYDYIENNKNRKYGTGSGIASHARVYVLSGEDVFLDNKAVRHGFYAKTGVDDPAKRFRPTMYAMSKGTWYSPVDTYRGNGFWFMRTNGYSPSSATYICDMGYIYDHGTDVTCNDSGVLPVIRVDAAKAEPVYAGKVSS